MEETLAPAEKSKHFDDQKKKSALPLATSMSTRLEPLALLTLLVCCFDLCLDGGFESYLAAITTIGNGKHFRMGTSGVAWTDSSLPLGIIEDNCLMSNAFDGFRTPDESDVFLYFGNNSKFEQNIKGLVEGEVFTLLLESDS